MSLRAFVLCSVLHLTSASAAQPLWPDVSYDPEIPTLKSVVGWDFGEEITPPDGIVTYLKALAAAAPDRVRLVEYGRTWEQRRLYVIAISSRERTANLDAIKAGLARLADPRGLAPAEADRLLRELPVVTWLMHAVHGDEISSSDAALAEAYHLLAAQGDVDVDQVLRESVILIDPLQNPDGRARFLASNLQGRAAMPDPEPSSAEHEGPWPGGRGNHYLFDMNRDWFSQSQPETQGRTKLYLGWYPHVVVDLHETGSGNSNYYFAPPVVPLNPHITKDQVKWFEVFGRANAANFDQRGFSYFIREEYDSFYPGYGETWSIFNGAVGMTYEQASATGLVFLRDDGTLLTYRDGVVRHFTAAITTAITAARNRGQILRDFFEYRRSAVVEGEQGVREYLLLPGADPTRAGRLARLLASQGIEVRCSTEPVRLASQTAPVGTYLVSAAQPRSRLIRNLLDPHTAMDETFIKEQDRRRRERIAEQIYDVTGWSLPLAFDVELATSDRPLAVNAVPLTEAVVAPPPPPSAMVAYMIPWGSGPAAAVVDLLESGVRVHTADRPLTMNGRRFPVGTAIIRVAEHDAKLLSTLGTTLARHPAVEVVPTDSGWVEDGISLGSNEIADLKTPKVAMAWDLPTSSLSAGWMRYVIERRFGKRVTAVRSETLTGVDLRKLDVLALPCGTYKFSEDMLRQLKDWIRAGGTLVTVGEASRWATRDRVGLLDTDTLLRDGSPDVKPADEKKPAANPHDKADYDTSIRPEREQPENTPGALLRVRLDPEHWLSAGFDGEIQVLVESRRAFAPIKLDKGRNVGVFVKKERLLAGGHAWDNALTLLAEKPFIIHQPMGRGHVIAFAEDPNYRAFTEATELLFINAIVLGPAH